MIHCRSVALALCFVGAVLAQTSTAPTRPNFVIIVADDLGWRDLGCSGSTFYETPALDGLAAAGLSFSDAYAAAPVCSPTRASLMTGRSPARLATTDWFGGARQGRLLPASYVHELPLEEETIAEALRRGGYRTAFMGKWHLGGPGFWPEDQGFDVNVGGYTRGHPAAGYFSPYRNPRLADGPEGEFLTDRLGEEAVRYLQTPGEGPFLLFLSFYSVHTPLQAPAVDVREFEEKAAAISDDAPRFGREREHRVRLRQDHPTYAAMVRALDRNVGRVLTALAAAGHDDDTVVLFTSDNGGLSTSEGWPTSNRPLRAGKGWLYEGGIRVPFIIRGKGIARGSRSAVPVTSQDVFPTVLALAGVEPRPDHPLDGTSLAPVLENGPLGEERALYWHYPHYSNQGGRPGGAIRVGHHKLIESFEEDDVALYDLVADPGETRDLAATEVTLARDLRHRLQTWREDVGARMPRPNPVFEKRLRVRVDPGDATRVQDPIRVRIAPEYLAADDLADARERRIVVIGPDGRRRASQFEIVAVAGTPTVEVTWVELAWSDGAPRIFDVRWTRERDDAAVGRFSFASAPAGRVLRFGDRPVWEHVTTYDAARHDATSRPFYHLLAFRSPGHLTKGPGGLFSHHRGLFLGWKQVRSGERTWDFWSLPSTDTAIRHREDRAAEECAGAVFARTSSRIEWTATPVATVVSESRRVTTWRQLPGRYLMDFDIELAAAGVPVALDGDPAHGGFHFRAHQGVAEARGCRYLLPAASREVATDEWADASWVAALFDVGEEHLAVALLDHPDNPRPTVLNTRDYGRFGAFFRADIALDRPLRLRYRVVVMDRDIDQELGPATVESLYQSWLRPVTTAVVEGQDR